MSGAVLATMGLFGGSFARLEGETIVCVGIILGTGFCLLYLATLCTAMRRFPQTTGFVSCAMFAMSGVINLTVIAPLFKGFLLDNYTPHDSLLLNSGLVFHTAIFSLLLTSPLLHTSKLSGIQSASRDREDARETTAAEAHHGADAAKRNTESIQELVDVSKIGCERSRSRRNGASLDVSETTSELRENRQSKNSAVEHLRTEPEDGENEEAISELNDNIEEQHASNTLQQQQQQRVPSGCSRNSYGGSRSAPHIHQKAKGSLGSPCASSVAFLKNPLFLSVALLSVLVPPLIDSSSLLLTKELDAHGWTHLDVAFVMSIFGFFRLIGLIIIGVVSLHRRVKVMMLLAVSGVIGSAGVCFLGQLSSIPLACVMAACVGFGYGGVTGMVPPALLSAATPSALPLALGLVLTVRIVHGVVVGIVTGLILDRHPSYGIISAVYGVISLAASCQLFVFVLRCGKCQRGQMLYEK
ncbi:uncharacterized protein [Littorina saxatilis]